MFQTPISFSDVKGKPDGFSLESTLGQQLWFENLNP